AQAPVCTTEFEGGNLRLRNQKNDRLTSVDDIVAGGRALIAVLSGDGVTSRVGQDIAVTEHALQVRTEERSALLAEGFGNGNVLQNILNGAKGIRRPSQLISPEIAEMQDVPLIEIEINGETQYAVLGFGVGAIGEGARDLNAGKHRRAFGYNNDVIRTIVHEGRMGVRLSEKVKDGKIFVRKSNGKDPSSPQYEEELLVSRDYANGPLLAKHIVFPGQRLDSRSLRILTLKNPLELPLWTWGAQTDTWSREVLKEGEEDIFCLLTDTDAHFDGNHRVIDAGSTVKVRVSKLGFMAVANINARVTRPQIPLAAAVTTMVTSLPTKRQVGFLLNPLR
ncbi:MAG: hypothetical protein WBP03_01500, partial [Candidatus Saccharimonadales bacterium]